MGWEGKKVRYKVGRGSAVGTVCWDTGTHVFIQTAKGKKISRKIGGIVSEEKPEPAPFGKEAAPVVDAAGVLTGEQPDPDPVSVEKVQDFPTEQIEPMGF